MTKITKKMIDAAPRTGQFRFISKKDLFGTEFLALEIEVAVKVVDDPIAPTKLIPRKFWRLAIPGDIANGDIKG